MDKDNPRVDKETESLIELLKIASKEYADGKHCSTEELKEKLASKFNKQEKQNG